MAAGARQEDRELIEAVRGGDPSAYRGLVERYQGRVYALLCGMVRDREEARDLTQEAFIRAYRQLDRFRGDAGFYTWLYRIAMNVAIDHLRRQRSRRQEAFEEGVAARDGDGAIDPAHSRADPSRAVERQQIGEAIFQALEKLSDEHRQVILLREVEGLSYREIAEVMEIPEGTVMSRLFYARRKLRDLLREMGIEP